MELKPSYKSIEGIVFYAGFGICSLILSYLGIDVTDILKKDDLDGFITVATEVAKNADDVKTIWELSQKQASDVYGLGKFGGLLFFMYKFYTHFINKRTELKIEHMKLMKSTVKIEDENK